MHTIEQLAAEVAELKSAVNSLQAQHAGATLLGISQAAYTRVLSRFARQQGAIFDLADLRQEAREILIHIEGVSPELATALDAELTKLLGTEDSAR